MYPFISFFNLFQIHTFGLMVALGVLVAAWIIRRKTLSLSVSSQEVTDLMTVVVVTGFAGARLHFIIQKWDYFKDHLFEVLKIWEGGIVVYGGVIVSFFGFLIFCRIKKMPTAELFDIFMPAILIAQGFGRIGCFLNGCCYGASTTMPWAVQFPFSPQRVHPVQLYESAYCFLIGFLLLFLLSKPHRKGMITVSYFILYPGGRFVFEFFRGDNDRLAWGLTLPQWVSLVLIVSAISVFLIRKPDRGR